MPPNDTQLIAWLDAAATGNAAALKNLYDATAGRLYGLAMKICRDADMAQDVLQESFVQVWRNAADYRASLSPPLAWMGLIVRSRALDALRRRKAARLDVSDPLEGDDDDGPLAQLAHPDVGPDEQLQKSQVARALHACLDKLEAKQRDVVALAYLKDLSHTELAAQLQLPLGTVKSWIRRGLDHLRTCLTVRTGGAA